MSRVNPADLLAATAPYLSTEVGYLFFPHNWDGGFEERLAWLTDILAASDRTEQRLRLRRVPRRSWPLRLLVSGDQRRMLETWLGLRTVKFFLVPVWRDQSQLGIPVAAESTEIAIDTVATEYAVGTMVAIWDDWDHFELRKIVALAVDSITVDAAFTDNWPAGSMIAPCRFGLAADQRTGSRFTEDVAEWPLTFSPLFDPSFPAWAPTDLYQSIPVCPFSPSWESPEPSLANQWTKLDRDVGLIEYTIDAVEPIRARSAKWVVIGRDRIDTFLRFLHYASGRLKSFWLADDARGLEIVGTAAAGSHTIIINGINYVGDLSGSAARKDIELVLTDGTIIRRRITASTVYTDTEGLSIDTALPVSVSAAKCNRAAWMELVRFDADEITINWSAPDCLECTIPIMVLP